MGNLPATGAISSDTQRDSTRRLWSVRRLRWPEYSRMDPLLPLCIWRATSSMGLAERWTRDIVRMTLKTSDCHFPDAVIAGRCETLVRSRPEGSHLQSAP